MLWLGLELRISAIENNLDTIRDPGLGRIFSSSELTTGPSERSAMQSADSDRADQHVD